MSPRWQVVADDPTITHQWFIDRLNVTDNPRHRKMLETLVEHDRAEIDGDLDRVMATMVDEPQHGRWGPTGDTAPKGYDEVRSYCAAMFAGGGIGNLTVTPGHIVVDDHTIVAEHCVTRILPWQRAKAAGYAITDEDGHDAVHLRLVTFVPFDDEGRMVGEISYGHFPNPHDWDRVPDDELTPGYLAWLRDNTHDH